MLTLVYGLDVNPSRSSGSLRDQESGGAVGAGFGSVFDIDEVDFLFEKVQI